MTIHMETRSSSTSGGPVACCTQAVLFAGFITMFVIGILATQGIINLIPGGAYAMIALGSLAMVALIGVCCKNAKKTSVNTYQSL